MTEEQVEWRCG